VLQFVAGEKFVLRFHWPGGEALRVAPVVALHFLQENDVRLERAQALAQLVDHHAPVERRQALVDVERDYTQFRGHRRSNRKRFSKRSASSKWRRPTNAVACRPHWRIAPAEAMPIGQNTKRSGRSVPGTRPSAPKALARPGPMRCIERSSA